MDTDSVQPTVLPDAQGTAHLMNWLRSSRPSTTESEKRAARPVSQVLPESELEAAWLGTIVAIVELGAMAYGVFGKKNDPIDKVLRNVLDVVSVVETRLQAVQSQLASLMLQLQQVETRIRGHITESFLLQNLSDVKTSIQIITPLISNEAALDDPERLAELALERNNLHRALNAAHTFSGGGVAGAFLIVPGAAVWAHATMVLRRKRGASFNTVWDEPFHRAMVALFDTLFDENALLESQHERELAAMPVWIGDGLCKGLRREGVVHSFDAASRRFVPSTHRRCQDAFFPDPAPAEHGLFTAAGDSVDGTYYGRAPGTLPPTPGLPAPPDGWWWAPVTDANLRLFADPARAKAAATLAALQAGRRREIAAHRQVMAHANAYRKLFDIFVKTKPAEWDGPGSAPDTHLVYLVNETWAQVNVEIRRGREHDCGLNAAFDTKLVSRGESLGVPVPEVDICYRRDRIPDRPNGTWTDWRRVPHDPDRPARVVRIT